MKYKILITIFFLSFSLFAQEKGVKPLSNNKSPKSGKTYAVIVGISDYQDESIPDLRFADKDAEAFAAFLQSPAGGGLDEDHLKVLLNEKATVAQFAIQLDWLMEVAGENDRVIVYFSGHGDVERKTITQPGYLLCWDAPSKIYLAGGALALPMFQDVITTLSIQNKAKVVVITDACRSGKLSGSSVGGAQITGTNLAKQYANEIKILSCQPDEYSIEGEQWGGGRGAFSYHLLDGLSGMADGNADNAVNLREIRNYLEENVAEEVAPQSQNPMIIGNKTEKLTDVFPELLAKIKEGKKAQMQLFTATESRGIEDDVLAKADTNIVEMYLAFKKTLEDKNFLFAGKGSPENDYADFYYEKLSKEPQLKRLHSSMRRNYAATLQDDAQQVMNNWMKTGVDKVKTPSKEFKDKVKAFPRYLDRAAELLGREHYMHSTLIARKHFFEGYILTDSPPKEGMRILNEYRKALKIQPEMPQAYWQMSWTFLSKFSQIDSAIFYTDKVIELYPSWILPYTDLAFSLSFPYKQFDLAEPYLNAAMKIDSTSSNVWNANAVFNYFQGREKEAEKSLKKVIKYDSTNAQAYHNLGHIYKNNGQSIEAEKYFLKAFHFDSTNYIVVSNLAGIVQVLNKFEEAAKLFKTSTELNPNYNYGHLNLGDVLQNMERWEESEAPILKGIELDSTVAVAFALLGHTYIHLEERFDEAEILLNKALEMDPEGWHTYIYYAKYFFKMKQPNKAWQYLEQGLEKNLSIKEKNYEKLSIDFLENRLHFDEMQQSPKWNQLLQKYFPDQYKTSNE